MSLRDRIHGRVALVLGLVLLLPRAASAQATPYVPPLDPAYRDVEALVSAGLVRGLVLGQRPWSRLAFARAAVEARGRGEAGGIALEPRFAEALARLGSRFQEDIARLCAPGGEPCAEPRASARVRGLAADVSWADSPLRAVPTGYDTASRIDADIAPLIQRNLGRKLADGGTVAVLASGDITLGSRFAASLGPRVWLGVQHPDGQTDLSVQLEHGYLHGLLGNLSVDLGRGHAPRGAARDYAVAVSSNARGLDMVRVSMERPARLPWLLRHLGPARFAAWAGDLGRDRDNPGSKLIVLEGALQPHPDLELGATLQNQQFGEGIPPAGWADRVRDVLGILPRWWWGNLDGVGEISDKAMAFDARVRIPSQGLELYAEVLTTDDHNIFLGWREALWNDAAWAWGGRLTGWGPGGRLDARLEAGRVGVRPYSHHQFTSGTTLDRRVIGSPLGPLGAGVSGALAWNGTGDVVEVGAAWERYSGDRYQKPEGPGWAQRLVRVEDNPDEIRLRATLDWERAPRVRGLRTSVRLGYERVTRFAFTDQSRSNFLAQVGVGWSW